MQNDSPIFDYYAPRGSFIGLVSIPHSGEKIPEEFTPYLVSDVKLLGKDVDTAVHQLVDIEELQNQGIAVLKANIHRVCVDLNRDKQICVLNWEHNSHGERLVHTHPTSAQMQLLSQKYHAPYYEMMYALIHELEKKAKIPAFIDLHSMPSAPTEYHLKTNPNQALQRPDFCVSDRKGESCRPEFIDFVCDELSHHYPHVTKNDPYVGGNITKHINDTFAHIDNIQIEINRSRYMDEATRELIASEAKKLKAILTTSMINIFKHFY